MESRTASEDDGRDAGPARRAALSLRLATLAALGANAAFLLLLIMADFLPTLVYLGCVVFLLVGLWVGRRSRRPWADGAMYGGLSTLAAALLLMLLNGMGWLGWLAAFFLAFPQGIAGTWLGARLGRRRT